jgi:hypothetical protein
MRQFLATQSRVMSAFLGGLPATVESPTHPVPLSTAVPASAPMPAPRAMPAAMPAPVTAPVPPEPPQVATDPAPAAGDRDALPRAALVDLLLGLVEEKTGYPRDMVGLDQGLEADLGIDSIKRIEVVGAMLQILPEPMREALTPNRSKLNTQPTLNGMLDILVQAAPGASAKAAGSVHELHAEERRRA